VKSPRTGPIIGNAYIMPWWNKNKPIWALVCYVGSKDEYGNYGGEALHCCILGDREEA
jgi:hypothetical protein